MGHARRDETRRPKKGIASRSLPAHKDQNLQLAQLHKRAGNQAVARLAGSGLIQRYRGRKHQARSG